MMYTGMALSIISPILGIVGTLWFIYSSFSAMEMAEAAGIGPVGSAIRSALICTIGGIVGVGLGLTFIAIGGRNFKQG